MLNLASMMYLLVVSKRDLRPLVKRLKMQILDCMKRVVPMPQTKLNWHDVLKVFLSIHSVSFRVSYFLRLMRPALPNQLPITSRAIKNKKRLLRLFVLTVTV